MKRVLFLAYLFPPIANSGTQRPLKFAKYLQRHGWAPTVLTAADFDGHATDAGLLEDIPPGVDVVRVPMAHQRLTEVARRLLGARIGGRLGGAIGWRLQHRYRTPDWYALWRPTARRAAMQLFRETGFDAIYATGYPWTSLITAVDISRASGRPLIVDFRDLWSVEPHFLDGEAPRHVQAALERTVVEHAQTVIGSSQSIVRWLQRAYSHVPEEKFVAIHNGFDDDDLQPEQTPRPVGRFRMVFTGVWKNRYNPAELYDSLDWLRRLDPQIIDRVEVIAAGFTPGEARRRGLDQFITELGHVPHAEAVALMQSADLLFLTHTDPERQWAVPGKLYEYLASGAPILALTHPDKETAQILRAVGGGVVVGPDDPGLLYDTLRDVCRTGRFVVPPRDRAKLATFERRQLTAKLAAVLDRAYTTRSSGAGSSADSDSTTLNSYAGSTSVHPATRVVS